MEFQCYKIIDFTEEIFIMKCQYYRNIGFSIENTFQQSANVTEILIFIGNISNETLIIHN